MNALRGSWIQAWAGQLGVESGSPRAGRDAIAHFSELNPGASQSIQGKSDGCQKASRIQPMRRQKLHPYHMPLRKRQFNSHLHAGAAALFPEHRYSIFESP
jgi:hypothetical protein